MIQKETFSLSDLLKQIPVKVVSGQISPLVRINGIAFDSRTVEPGNLFVALVGENSDGHRFIDAAVERGAVAILGMRADVHCEAPYLQVDDTRSALAHLSAALQGFPARQLTVIGVTGTDGKTTTSNLIYQILIAAGIRAGMISTVNAVIGDQVVDTGFHVTTPEAPDVQRYLRQMVDAGLTHVVLETTSHGLIQHRVTGCEYDIAVVTNVTHEHLDYHRTYENYLAAKGRLFEMLSETVEKPAGNIRLGVLNRDDRSFDYLNGLPIPRRSTYSLSQGADLYAEGVRHSPAGLEFIAVGREFKVPVACRLVGNFNISNCLAALSATVLGLGIDPQTAARGIAALPGVPGRMEIIDLGQNFTAIVDFAHTPNGLTRALETARDLTAKRVIAVFGSAGLRDRQKRHMMAEISAQMADISILTAEDPRTESLDGILAEMGAAATARGGAEGKTFYRIPDRGEAIRMAVNLAQPGDLVIACGKGHEQSMCFGTQEYAWDDRTAMRAALAERLRIAGPEMPFLPTRGKS
ncbi:UDP-N-acetylmuramoylalanyl-D-glutamate--2,6-diaminopimelate ligase [Longilinea arvoryzae]|uniref:UDP-N-acetylmuramyl-tripeptide synthetase n=1 Tax=Longilinea arvoryzae TaxID=360412 RepID=A0A0S7BLB4_9CHLR|nr:UDP-N-acetylmuramoylalanyl-D-glutamate--2,6-diaminopimelate ligase [Longilinea arvoryzae]